MLSPMGKMAYYEQQHLIIVQDVEEAVAYIAEFVLALWEVPAHVYIDSNLIEVTLEEGEALGMNWNVLTKIGESGKSALDPVGGVDYPGTSLRSTATNNAAVPNTTPFTFGIVNANIDAVLEAVKRRERVNLRSNPRVLVRNHRRATIIVGQEIPYLSSTESGTQNPINTYEFKEVAVRLEVTPHISDDGMIFMDVHSQAKSLIGYQGDPPQPVLSTRELVIYAAVPDRETLVIGGLVQRSINNTRWNTPFISRIPLIGLLFRQKRDIDTKNDLVFMLNPRIVKPGDKRKQLEEKSHLLVEPPKHPLEVKPIGGPPASAHK